MKCSHCDGYARRAEEWDELKKIVDRIPTTVDGMSLLRCDFVWFLRNDGVIQKSDVLCENGKWMCVLFGMALPNDKCYSTREAAENAAKENKS